MIKRKINVFKVTNGRIEYVDLIKQAVLDPKITFKHIHMNGGWDWIDEKYKFIKLLISRGQILEVETHQDLLAKNDYLEAAKLGVFKAYSFKINFVAKPLTKKCSGASEKRIEAAKNKWIEFINNK